MPQFWNKFLKSLKEAFQRVRDFFITAANKIKNFVINNKKLSIIIGSLTGLILIIGPAIAAAIIIKKKRQRSESEIQNSSPGGPGEHNPNSLGQQDPPEVVHPLQASDARASADVIHQAPEHQDPDTKSGLLLFFARLGRISLPWKKSPPNAGGDNGATPTPVITPEANTNNGTNNGTGPDAGNQNGNQPGAGNQQQPEAPVAGSQQQPEAPVAEPQVSPAAQQGDNQPGASNQQQPQGLPAAAQQGDNQPGASAVATQTDDNQPDDELPGASAGEKQEPAVPNQEPAKGKDQQDTPAAEGENQEPAEGDEQEPAEGDEQEPATPEIDPNNVKPGTASSPSSPDK